MSAQVEQRKSLSDFIAENQISITFDYADSNPVMPDSGNMDHYRVTLRSKLNRTQMTLTYSKGYGHHGKPPEVAEVLDCLAMDTSGADTDFEDWCGNYGYDTDSRSAERIYKATVKQAKQLRKLLGDEAFQDLLENVERM